jgi:hypothetical protein
VIARRHPDRRLPGIGHIDEGGRRQLVDLVQHDHVVTTGRGDRHAGQEHASFQYIQHRTPPLAVSRTWVKDRIHTTPTPDFFERRLSAF